MQNHQLRTDIYILLSKHLVPLVLGDFIAFSYIFLQTAGLLFQSMISQAFDEDHYVALAGLDLSAAFVKTKESAAHHEPLCCIAQCTANLHIVTAIFPLWGGIIAHEH